MLNQGFGLKTHAYLYTRDNFICMSLKPELMEETHSNIRGTLHKMYIFVYIYIYLNASLAN